MAESEADCPQRRNRHAWCTRGYSNAWHEIHEDWVLSHPECLRAETIDRSPAPGDTWSVCTAFAPGICPDSRIQIHTPLILRFGPFAGGPRYAWGPGRFDLSRHQDGSGRVKLWVEDAFLVRLPTAGAPLTARHLFGEATLDADGKPSFVDGFDALATMADLDGDGWVKHDETSSLGAWFDDGDQIVDPGELVPLADLGVLAVRVEPFTRTREGWHPSGRGFVEGRAVFRYLDPFGEDLIAEGEVMDVYLR